MVVEGRNGNDNGDIVLAVCRHASRLHDHDTQRTKRGSKEVFVVKYNLLLKLCGGVTLWTPMRYYNVLQGIR